MGKIRVICFVWMRRILRFFFLLKENTMPNTILQIGGNGFKFEYWLRAIGSPEPYGLISTNMAPKYFFYFYFRHSCIVFLHVDQWLFLIWVWIVVIMIIIVKYSSSNKCGEHILVWNICNVKFSRELVVIKITSVTLTSKSNMLILCAFILERYVIVAMPTLAITITLTMGKFFWRGHQWIMSRIGGWYSSRGRLAHLN